MRNYVTVKVSVLKSVLFLNQFKVAHRAFRKNHVFDCFFSDLTRLIGRKKHLAPSQIRLRVQLQRVGLVRCHQCKTSQLHADGAESTGQWPKGANWNETFCASGHLGAFSMVHPFAHSQHALLVVAVHLLLAGSAKSAQWEQRLARVAGSCLTCAWWIGIFRVVFARWVVSKSLKAWFLPNGRCATLKLPDRC